MGLSNTESALIAVAESELTELLHENDDGRKEAALQRLHALRTVARITDEDDHGLSNEAVEILRAVLADAERAFA